MVWDGSAAGRPQLVREYDDDDDDDGGGRGRPRQQQLARAAGRLAMRPLSFAEQAFLPDDVTPEYYEYTAWRCLQRFISSTTSVLGVQAMLLALGRKSATAGLGAAAATNWVLKDALGKGARMLWASRMGRSFDADAKRWRFRSSLLYAAGSGLEVATFACPPLFLLFATVATCLKQVSMLTSTATRNAIYRSFIRPDSTTDNIGDITAKGEAQIAVVDLLGMIVGIVTARWAAARGDDADDLSLIHI